jgi:RNA polymerase sigma factor (sigma-70 family)
VETVRVREPGAFGSAEEPVERERHAALYRAHASQVYTHFCQRGVDRGDAEDLTAEVFAITWRRRDAIQPHPTAGMIPWLLATANYLLRERHRAITRARRALSRIALPAGEPDIAEELTESAHDRARLEILARVLKKLTIPEQEVIQYCVLRGLSPTVVADVTGEPVGTIRSRLSRALTRARTAYAAIATDDVPRNRRRQS